MFLFCVFSVCVCWSMWIWMNCYCLMCLFVLSEKNVWLVCVCVVMGVGCCTIVCLWWIGDGMNDDDDDVMCLCDVFLRVLRNLCVVNWKFVVVFNVLSDEGWCGGEEWRASDVVALKFECWGCCGGFCLVNVLIVCCLMWYYLYIIIVWWKLIGD